MYFLNRYSIFLRFTVILFSGDNGIDRGIEKFEWHISKFSFCNGMSPICELGNGIDPINPISYCVVINLGNPVCSTISFFYYFFHFYCLWLGVLLSHLYIQTTCPVVESSSAIGEIVAQFVSLVC